MKPKSDAPGEGTADAGGGNGVRSVERDWLEDAAIIGRWFSWVGNPFGLTLRLFDAHVTRAVRLSRQESGDQSAADELAWSIQRMKQKHG